jgi:hypothetical protein
MKLQNNPFERGCRVHVRGVGLARVHYAVRSTDGSRLVRICAFVDGDRRFDGYEGRVFDSADVSLVVGEGGSYYDCRCRDCFEIIPDILCNDCTASGCEPDRDCRVPGAYGADDAKEAA